MVLVPYQVHAKCERCKDEQPLEHLLSCNNARYHRANLSAAGTWLPQHCLVAHAGTILGGLRRVLKRWPRVPRCGLHHCSSTHHHLSCYSLFVYYHAYVPTDYHYSCTKIAHHLIKTQSSSTPHSAPTCKASPSAIAHLQAVPAAP